ncbi:unnamed protein product [Ilex paraguariensis]|uniref:Uncharacterized protein n=1 Tax=Ilex paraguariensis TaxID=185542 RepID=A0ABC8SLN3_9AQUA
MVKAYDSYFVQKQDTVGITGLSSLQKMTAVIRMIAYGITADVVDDFVRMGESTPTESLKRFMRVVVTIFSDKYLRSPNNDDIVKLLAISTNCGFPEMLDNIDCMNWKMKNCPIA